MEKIILTICMMLILSGSLLAEALNLDPMFTDNMVLQRGVAAPVWGTSDIGDKITVSFSGQTKEVVADKDGKWMAMLAPLKVSSEPQTMTVSSSSISQSSRSPNLQIKNILVGDVWICSGQSNMFMRLKDVNNSEAEIASAKHPEIRLFQVKRSQPKDAPAKFALGKWQACSPETVADFSAVGYFFGEKVNRDLKVPVGLIQSSVGGTQVERWIPKEVLDPSEEYLAPPGDLYDGMIHPLRQFAVKGFLWYQGESNGRLPETYYKLFPKLIRTWRNIWLDGNPTLTRMPFLFVQLAPYRDNVDNLAPDAWAYIREAQLKTLSLPDTGMAVTTDLGEYEDIHPKNKRPAGERLALLAERLDGGKVVASGPLFDRAEVQGNKMIVYFKEIGSGLETRKVVMNRKKSLPTGTDPEAFTVPAEKLAGFTICGAVRKFVEADAKIAGAHVEVSSPSVAAPVAVRYGWATFPLCNLYNREGLPASPFRSDDFPVPDVQGRKTGEAWKGDASKLGDMMVFKGSSVETEWTELSVDGQKGYQPLQGQKSNLRFAYFKTDNPDFKSGKCPGVIISLLYFDQGRGTISLQYDSSDAEVKVSKDRPGAWKDGGRLKLEDTKTWRRIEFELNDAQFDGRCNGGDLRLNCVNSFVLGGVYCRRK